MSNMTLEQRVLLELLSGEITGESEINKEDLKAVNWNGVLKEARAQAVPLMAAEAAAKYKEYISNYEKWKDVMTCTHFANVVTAYSEQQLGQLMGDRSYFILKGMSAASYYPKPHERCFGDIDFLIDPSQRDEIERLLENSGYKNWNKEHICHVVFTKENAHLEMHFEISGIPYGKPGEIIRDFMKGAVEHQRTAEFDGWSFPAPEDMYHGLIILLHMQHHMLSEGVGLRHICDWACYVQKTENGDFWKELLNLFERVGLLTYAKVITRLSAKYFHIHCPNWAEDADEQLCDDLMQDILFGGNFGRKDIVRSKSGMMISEHGKCGTQRGSIANLFWTLHHSTSVKYPIVKKCVLLYPFLDAWRVILYTGRMVTGKRKSILKMAPLAKQRRSVYERLHLFEIE